MTKKNIAETNKFAEYLGIATDTLRGIMGNDCELLRRAERNAIDMGKDGRLARERMRERLRRRPSRGHVDVIAWFLAFAPEYVRDDAELARAVNGTRTWAKASDLAREFDVSDRPEGPYKDLLGKPLINEIVNGAQPIDQFVFHDADNDEYYMYYGGWKHCNMVRLNKDFTGLIPFEDGTIYKEVTPKDYVEGPFMFKKNGKYYFMWSEGGWTGPDYKVAYAISDSPFGPFNRIGEVLRQNFDMANGAGHHSIMHVPNSEDYYIVYHRRPAGVKTRDHRETCIEKMTFNEEGLINPVEITTEGVEARTIQ